MAEDRSDGAVNVKVALPSPVMCADEITAPAQSLLFSETVFPSHAKFNPSASALTVVFLVRIFGIVSATLPKHA